MELSSFSEHIITEVFERDGETLELRINIDAILPDYFDVLEERLKEIEKRYTPKKLKKGEKAEELSTFKVEKRLLEIQREAYAEMLTCPVKLPDGSTTSFLKGWDMTENGMPLEASKEVLLRLPPRAVKELFDFCKSKAATVKKRADEEETSEQSPAGMLRAV